MDAFDLRQKTKGLGYYNEALDSSGCQASFIVVTGRRRVASSCHKVKPAVDRTGIDIRVRRQKTNSLPAVEQDLYRVPLPQLGVHSAGSGAFMIQRLHISDDLHHKLGRKDSQGHVRVKTMPSEKRTS